MVIPASPSEGHQASSVKLRAHAPYTCAIAGPGALGPSHLNHCIRRIDYSHMGFVPRCTPVLIVCCHLVLYTATSLYVFRLILKPSKMHCYTCISIYRHPCTHHPLAYMHNTIVICTRPRPSSTHNSCQLALRLTLRPLHMLDITPLNPACYHVHVQ